MIDERELKFFYKKFIEKNNRKKIKNLEEDEQHNLVVHTFEVLVLDFLKTVMSEKEDELQTLFEEVCSSYQDMEEKTQSQAYKYILDNIGVK